MLSFKDSPSGRALRDQVEREKQTYAADVVAFHMVKSIRELETLGPKLEKTCDAVLVDSLAGVTDNAGRPLTMSEALRSLSAVYWRPLIGANSYQVRAGALSAVVKTGEEQGRTAAKMLLQAMRGKAVSDIPVTRNYRGRRIINVTTMELLGIRPRPIDLRGANLVRSEN